MTGAFACFGGTFLAAERTHFDNVFVVAFFKHDFAVGWQALCGLVQISLCFALGTEGFQIDENVFAIINLGALTRYDLFDFNMCRALVDETQLLGGGFGNIDHAVAVERTAVVDADDDAFTVFGVGHTGVAGNGDLA